MANQSSRQHQQPKDRGNDIMLINNKGLTERTLTQSVLFRPDIEWLGSVSQLIKSTETERQPRIIKMGREIFTRHFLQKKVAEQEEKIRKLQIPPLFNLDMELELNGRKISKSSDPIPSQPPLPPVQATIIIKEEPPDEIIAFSEKINTIDPTETVLGDKISVWTTIRPDPLPEVQYPPSPCTDYYLDEDLLFHEENSLPPIEIEKSSYQDSTSSETGLLETIEAPTATAIQNAKTEAFSVVGGTDRLENPKVSNISSGHCNKKCKIIKYSPHNHGRCWQCYKRPSKDTNRKSQYKKEGSKGKTLPTKSKPRSQSVTVKQKSPTKNPSKNPKKKSVPHCACEYHCCCCSPTRVLELQEYSDCKNCVSSRYHLAKSIKYRSEEADRAKQLLRALRKKLLGPDYVLVKKPPKVPPIEKPEFLGWPCPTCTKPLATKSGVRRHQNNSACKMYQELLQRALNR